MTGFVQIISWRSSRLDDVRALNEQWRDRHPKPGPTRVTVCAVRNRPGTYLTIVEFPSHEAAMANSEHPATQEFAARMNELCDGPPDFWDCDVVMSELQALGEQRSAVGSLTDA